MTHRSNEPVAPHSAPSAPGGGPRWRRLALLLVAGLTHGTASAQVHLVPEVSAQATYDSNIFALSSRDEAVTQNGDARRGDTEFRYTAGTAAEYQWDIQKAFATLEGRRLQYEHFDRLNHDEFLLSGGLSWHIGEAIDGVIDYRQERAMAAFADVRTGQLTMQRERRAGTTLNALIAPEWRVESGIHNHRLALPLPAVPDYALSENTVDAAIKYLGVQKLSAGVNLQYLWGSYDGGVAGDRFNQETAEATARYVVSGLSSVGAKLGYTRRHGQAGNTESVSGLTGSLAYERRISGKTSLDAEVIRQVSSYVAGANAVTDTGARFGLSWQPTYKINTAMRYEWTYSEFQDVGGMSAGRRDHYQSVQMSLSYQPVQWLSIRPYVGYRDRHSNIESDGYNDFTAGILVLLRTGGRIGADDSPLRGPAGAPR